MRTPQLFNLWMKNLFESTLACHHSLFKPVVKQYLNSIMWTVEEMCSSEMAQNGVCGVLYHVMSHYGRKIGTLKIKASVKYCESSHFNPTMNFLYRILRVEGRLAVTMFG